MFHPRTSLLGVVILGCTGLLLAAGVGSASGDRPALVGAASTRSDLEHSEREGLKESSSSMMMAGGLEGCIEGAPLKWFGLVRPLPECFSRWANHDLRDAQDWNRDGHVEFIETVAYLPITEAGTAQPSTCIAYLVTTGWNGSAITVTRNCILSSGDLLDYVTQSFPGQTVSTDFYYGWRDLDTDGDLDLVVTLLVGGLGGTSEHRVWLENTGYEANDGLAADLNGDGEVDGKDLAAVLAAWTG